MRLFFSRIDTEWTDYSAWLCPIEFDGRKPAACMRRRHNGKWEYREMTETEFKEWADLSAW